MIKLLKLGNAIFFTLAFFWFYFSIYFLFQYLNIDYTNLSDALAKLLIIFVIFLFLTFYFKRSFIKIIKRIFRFLLDNKIYVFIAMLIFQFIITLTSLGLASADTTIVYKLATNSNFASKSDYISIFPNNFLLVVWMKFNYFLFRENTVFALACWNILFIDLSILIDYHIHKKVFNKSIANISFMILILIIGLSPQYIYTYSDSVTLFLLSLFLFTVVATGFAKNRKKIVLPILSGVILAFAYGFRPTILIFVIAGVIVLLNQLLSENQRYFVIKSAKTILIGLIAFVLLNKGISYTIKHQTIVNYEPEKSRTLLYFIDLGLTYSGNIHSEISEKVRESEGKDRNRQALAEIRTRFKDYNFTTFIGHLSYKYYWITGEGMFGWYQEKVLNENQRLKGTWLQKIQDTKFASLIRTYVYVDGENYLLYGLFMQIIWIIISFGLLVSAFFFSLKNSYQLWMQIALFGGLIFLMIFEGGRTRYLIQFLPAIVTMSSIGLYNLYKKFITKVRETA